MPVLESGNIFKKNFNKDSNPPIELHLKEDYFSKIGGKNEQEI
jgi:hypothetical protein